MRGQDDGDWIYGGEVLAAVGPCLYASSGGIRAHDACSLACSPMAMGVVSSAVPGHDGNGFDFFFLKKCTVGAVLD